MEKIIISNKVHYLGTNDRRKHLFENNWPLPQGVSYNSYLIADDKSALIDTLEFGSRNDYIESIAEILDGKELNYLIINHMEPDHSGMAGMLLHRYPNLRIVGNSKTIKMAETYFKIPKEQFLEVTDGTVLDLGYHKLNFVLTPWVHWPETMMTYESTDSILFSCDAFGSFGTLDGGIFDDQIDFEYRYEDEMRRYYSNIVGKYSNMVQKAFAKLEGIPLKFICPSHGPVWRENPGKAIALYNKWSRHESVPGVVIAVASMYGNTEEMADYAARLIAAKGIKNIRIYDVSKTHSSYIISDIWKFSSLLLGSCAYNTGVHPMMANLCHELEVVNPKNKKYALFGSYSWSGGGVRTLEQFAEKMTWQRVADPVELIGVPDLAKMEGFRSVAENII
ncbi:MAG: FprA family A-type flavoprotein [Bacteroidales bacterium]|nr:FprA family A-type flavoprotein [Bacteroidales bacterium]MDD2424487.1 FprA family A-type flavoprotein [Bacteroidales bacterium]MDD3988531.1 FprA family A-type flavoprotein [Bacteroidales bacterium]MDD4638394.1 FprA family A-type flavoprotein [Bacteroidales bacterium]